MRTIRDWVIFIAGFEAFHTISHIFIAFFVNLPFVTKYVTLTSTVNTWAILINGLITIALMWLARRLN